jgi:hypothetical protein
MAVNTADPQFVRRVDSWPAGLERKRPRTTPQTKVSAKPAGVGCLDHNPG